MCKERIKNKRLVFSAVDESLIQRLALRNGLHDLAVRRHKPNGPLPQPRAAEPKHIAGGREQDESDQRNQRNQRKNQKMMNTLLLLAQQEGKMW